MRLYYEGLVDTIMNLEPLSKFCATFSDVGWGALFQGTLNET